MYPTVVMLLVETQRSMMDVYGISPSNATKLGGPVAFEARAATLGHLPSAVDPGNSTTVYTEAETRLSRTLQSRGGQEYDLEEVTLEVRESQVG